MRPTVLLASATFLLCAHSAAAQSAEMMQLVARVKADAQAEGMTLLDEGFIAGGIQTSPRTYYRGTTYTVAVLVQDCAAICIIQLWWVDDQGTSVDLSANVRQQSIGNIEIGLLRTAQEETASGIVQAPAPIPGVGIYMMLFSQ